MPDLLDKKSYRYTLPDELIAQYPLAERQNSRLMVVHRDSKEIKHKHFYDLPDFLHPGDVLVLNKTKVFPARLFGKKENGTQIEVFLLHQSSDKIWQCLVHPGKRIRKPQRIIFSEDLTGFVSDSDSDGIRNIELEYEGNIWDLLHKYGHVPLPPYIDRPDDIADHKAYQTVYATELGSVAAPTAGFHFTQELLEKLQGKGVIQADITLHVGLGTFRPVKVDTITEHQMHSEFCILPEKTAAVITAAKREKRRIVAVGTTSVRTLESFGMDGTLKPGEKWTDIFIYPGKKFNVVDAVITNFHLPESTLIMLVAAFMGYDLTISAYQTAVAEKYRFYSYGDAMLIT